MRINKYIALCGVASRRKAEELILAGRVTVNDEVMTELSYKVDEENDIVKVDDKLIKEENKLVYIQVCSLLLLIYRQLLLYHFLHLLYKKVQS